MRSPWWIVAVGASAFSAFFWAIGGAVDMGLEEHARGRYGLPDGGERYTYALFGGAVIAAGSALALAGRRVPGWKTALLPASGLGFGAVSVLVLGQQTRHWIAAGAMGIAGIVMTLAALRRGRASRPPAGRRAPG
ncbi:hypothetical protein ACF1G0_07815 [Streptomyces sp. NPDC013953]|uniref:hypothetical protein n=1 Tax=Streptomyces sp. NPDC013953 TaxID=3364868 RepID=UPI0037026651